MQLLGTNLIMKILKKPTNIYEVIVSKSVAVTYKVYACSSTGAMDKALNSWEKTSVELIESTTNEQNVESIECVEKDIYNDL